MNRLSDLFSGSLSVNGARTALIEPGEGSLSYTGLSGRVSDLSACLRRAAVGAGDRVGICLSKRASSVASILAVLELQAAYVPVDVNGSSIERMCYILADCRARAVIVESDMAAQLAEQLPCPCETRELEGFDVALLVCDWSAADAVEFSDELAIILYTSGSTGTPKGVQLTHGNALTFVQWGADTFSVSSG